MCCRHTFDNSLYVFSLWFYLFSVKGCMYMPIYFRELMKFNFKPNEIIVFTFSYSYTCDQNSFSTVFASIKYLFCFSLLFTFLHIFFNSFSFCYINLETCLLLLDIYNFFLFLYISLVLLNMSSVL